MNFVSQTVTLNNLTINSTSLLSTAGTLNIAGSLSSSGTFTHNSGTVNFNGSGAQTIPALVFFNLALSNAGIKSILNATTITAKTLTINNSASLELQGSGLLNLN